MGKCPERRKTVVEPVPTLAPTIYLEVALALPHAPTEIGLFTIIYVVEKLGGGIDTGWVPVRSCGKVQVIANIVRPVNGGSAFRLPPRPHREAGL